MARITKGDVVELNEVRTMVRNEIVKRYGSVAKFLASRDAEKFGGAKIRCYLYNSGAVNSKVISDLCSYFKLGNLSSELVITRKTVYRFRKSTLQNE